ncbi:YqzH family protein [Bacillus carboniphilus]|uniref:YqzH family protein n=1 Tax=Bacillus carboniphilus TaxID=86663 RepID=UPI0031DEB3BE
MSVQNFEEALIPYTSGVEDWDIRVDDYEVMYKRVMERKAKTPEHEIYELVEDVVYEYITNDANM